MRRSILFLLLAAMGAYIASAQEVLQRQGHRGYRGLMPENTIAGMKKALQLGVVISKDKQVIVSHDPYLTPAITLKPNGDTLSKEEQKNFCDLFKALFRD